MVLDTCKVIIASRNILFIVFFTLTFNLCGIDHVKATDANAKWVDFNYTGIEIGTENQPFNTLAKAVDAVQSGGKIIIKDCVSINEPITINKNVIIECGVASTNTENWSGSWNCDGLIGGSAQPCDVSGGSLSLSLYDNMTLGQPYLSMHGTVTFSGSPCGLLSMDVGGGLGVDEVIRLVRVRKGFGVMLRIFNFSSTSMSGRYEVMDQVTFSCLNIGSFSLNKVD